EKDDGGAAGANTVVTAKNTPVFETSGISGVTMNGPPTCSQWLNSKTLQECNPVSTPSSLKTTQTTFGKIIIRSSQTATPLLPF
ncbi:MAG: hypothetical protein AB8H12_21945, partial [Lewinella sp.]